MRKLVLALLRSPNTWRDTPLTVIRMAWGLFFFASGFNKVFLVGNHAAMIDTLAKAGIPLPDFMATFVACFELGAGLALFAGLLSRLSASILTTITMVALLTVGIHHIPGGLSFLGWYSWLLYLPESCYLLIGILIMVQGGGPVALDEWIGRRLAGKFPVASV